MLVIDNPRELTAERYIYLPFWQRGHLSLKNGTSVTVCIIPRERDHGGYRMAELIISPIKFESWKNLWRINITFKDSPGVVRDLLKVLSSCDVDVLHYETCSIDSTDLHNVEIVVDVTDYLKIERDVADDKGDIPSLRRRIVALCCDNIQIYEQKIGEEKRQNFKIKIRRVNSLYATYNEYCERKEKNYDGLRPMKFKTKVQNFKIKLHEEIYRNILNLCSNYDDIYCPHPFSLKYILVSDTKDRNLRAFFPRRGDHVLYAQVGYLENIGALSDITCEVAKEFDILASYNHVHWQDRKSYLYLLVRPIDIQKHENSTYEILENVFSELISNIEDHSVDLKFPLSAGDPISDGINIENKKSMPLFFEKNTRRYGFDEKLLELPTIKILRKMEKHYYKLGNDREYHNKCYNNINVSNKTNKCELNRFKHTYEVLRRYILDSHNPVEERHVFVSADNENKHIFETTKKLLKKNNMDQITARNYSSIKTVRSKIIDGIKESHAFLAIWTLNKNGVVSPWLHWELGVAFLLRKKIILMRHEDVPIQQLVVMGESDYKLYNDDSCEESIRQIIEEIQS